MWLVAVEVCYHHAFDYTATLLLFCYFTINRYVNAGQELPAEHMDESLEFLWTEDWGFVDKDKDLDDSVTSDGGMSKSYYSTAVAHLLGWLVRNGCAIDRLDNHWECGVGSSGTGVHIEQQPLHWNALHASINVPPSVNSKPSRESGSVSSRKTI